MQNTRKVNKIGIDAIILALYFASTPIHQTLLLSNGGTVTKYLAFASMIAILFVEVNRRGTYKLKRNLVQLLLLLIIWFSVSVLWTYSVTSTTSSIISIISYFALMAMTCSKEWNNKEKKLFVTSLIIACIYYSVTLIQMVDTVKRATFISSTGKEADQNLLAVNIALGALFAFHIYLTSKRNVVRVFLVLAFLLMTTAIICTGSRGGIIALLSGLLFYMERQRRIGTSINYRVLIGLVLLLMALYYVLTSGILGNELIISRYIGEEAQNTSNRTKIWGEYFEAMLHRPIVFLLGSGYGAETRFYADYYMTRWPTATHNDIVCLLCSSGILGLFLVWRMIQKIWKRAKCENNNLGLACMVLVIVGGMTVDSFTRYGWWNAMIFSYIGIGVMSDE